MIPQAQLLTGSALGGALLWLGLLARWFQRPLDLSATVFLLLLLAILVNTPLALSLLQGRTLSFVGHRWVSGLQPVAAVAVAATAFVGPAGFSIGPLLLPWSALLTVPWLLFATLLALSALWQLPSRRQMDAPACLQLLALLFLPIGAAWLVAFQLGLQPLRFSGIIVLLTAVHFHFTGFAATMWASRIGAYLPQSNRTYPWFAGGFVLATPLIAVGITLSPLVEVVGVALLATCLVGLALLSYRHVLPMLRNMLAKILLSLAPTAMGVAIALAVIYAIGEFRQQPLLTIPQMVQWHGWLNGVGFTFWGLLGWRLAEYQPQV
ncbi:MAG: YndJ family transporter [Caldilineaceae bacterium]|nr:YndJ family transporter [Caldilineaceae bacterium]